MSMNTDEVIAKLRDWHTGRMSESYRIYTDMADAVQALKDENERLKELLDADTANGVVNDYQTTRIAELESERERLKGEVTQQRSIDKRLIGLLREPGTKTKISSDAAIDMILRLDAQITELHDENERLKAKCVDLTTDYANENRLVTKLEVELAELRKERVRYVERKRAETGSGIVWKEGNDGFGNYYSGNGGGNLVVPQKDGDRVFAVELPPRTPENTVPLEKEPTVVERVARMIFSCANALGISIAQHHREFIAEQLNAAGLLRGEP